MLLCPILFKGQLYKVCKLAKQYYRMLSVKICVRRLITSSGQWFLLVQRKGNLTGSDTVGVYIYNLFKIHCEYMAV